MKKRHAKGRRKKRGSDRRLANDWGIDLKNAPKETTKFLRLARVPLVNFPFLSDKERDLSSSIGPFDILFRELTQHYSPFPNDSIGHHFRIKRKLFRRRPSDSRIMLSATGDIALKDVMQTADLGTLFGDKYFFLVQFDGLAKVPIPLDGPLSFVPAWYGSLRRKHIEAKNTSLSGELPETYNGPHVSNQTMQSVVALDLLRRMNFARAASANTKDGKLLITFDQIDERHPNMTPRLLANALMAGSVADEMSSYMRSPISIFCKKNKLDSEIATAMLNFYETSCAAQVGGIVANSVLCASDAALAGAILICTQTQSISVGDVLNQVYEFVENAGGAVHPDVPGVVAQKLIRSVALLAASHKPAIPNGGLTLEF